MQHPIPVSASAAGPVPPPVDNLIADIFWVTGAGQVAQELASVPVQDGIALYDGPPLEPPFAWAVRIRRDGTPGALFRSGPLPQLPGPPSPELSGGIAFLVTPIGFSLTTRGSDGMPEIVEQQLRDLPAPLEFSSVQLTSDQAGHYVVTLHGRLRFGRRLGLPFLAPSFSYRRAFGLVGSLDPGRPVPPVLAQPTRPPGDRQLGRAPVRGGARPIDASGRGAPAGRGPPVDRVDSDPVRRPRFRPADDLGWRCAALDRSGVWDRREPAAQLGRGHGHGGTAVNRRPGPRSTPRRGAPGRWTG